MLSLAIETLDARQFRFVALGTFTPCLLRP